MGRVEWLRDAGISYRELEKSGHGFVVVEARLFYKRAAFFDDELVLRTELAELKKASLRFEYTLLRADEIVAIGYTRHGCISLSTGHPSRMPKELFTSF